MSSNHITMEYYTLRMQQDMTWHLSEVVLKKPAPASLDTVTWQQHTVQCDARTSMMHTIIYSAVPTSSSLHAAMQQTASRAGMHGARAVHLHHLAADKRLLAARVHTIKLHAAVLLICIMLPAAMLST